MESIAQEMRFPVDLRGGLMEQPQRGKLMRGDKNAAVVIVQLYEDQKPFEGEDVTVTGKFSRKGDGIDIELEGKMENGEASVVLDEHCFAVSGRYELRVKLTKGEIRRTVLFISGYVENDGEGGILDVENVIPSIDDIVAQYAEMKRVTEETRAARDEALLAAQSANFQILDRFDTLDLLYAAHPTGEAGQAYSVGSADDNVVYIWGVDTLAWVNIGKVQGPRGFQGEKGDQGESPTVTLTREDDGVVITTQAANGMQSEKINDGAQYDQGLNKGDDVVFNSVQTTDPLDADRLGGKAPDAYALNEKYEEWSFTLESGTTVKKKVLVVD